MSMHFAIIIDISVVCCLSVQCDSCSDKDIEIQHSETK